MGEESNHRGVAKPQRQPRGPKDITFPSNVKITEKDGKVITISVVVYVTAIYAPFYVNGHLLVQGGSHRHESWLRGYLKDIQRAKDRGAEVEEGPTRSLKEELQKANDALRHKDPVSGH